MASRPTGRRRVRIHPRERLGRSNWPSDETGRFAVISRQAWQACENPGARAGAPVGFGVAVSRDGRTAAIVACGPGEDGLPVLELADYRPGAGCAWTGPRLRVLTGRHQTAGVCWDPDSLAGPLGLATFTGRAKVIEPPRPGELAAACGRLMYAFEDQVARHTGEPQLTMAVGAARIRPSRAAWHWDDRAYATEILQAATWAMHARQAKVCPYDLLKSVGWPPEPRLPALMGVASGKPGAGPGSQARGCHAHACAGTCAWSSYAAHAECSRRAGKTTGGTPTVHVVGPAGIPAGTTLRKSESLCGAADLSVHGRAGRVSGSQTRLAPMTQWPDIPLIPFEWDQSDAYQPHANTLISEGHCPKHVRPLSRDGRCAPCGGVTWELTSSAGTASTEFSRPLPPWAVTDGQTVLVSRLEEGSSAYRWI